MALTQAEFNTAERIFNFIVKHPMGSIQFYRHDEEYRLFTVIAKGLTYNEKRYCDKVYVNLPQLNDWQYNNFVKKSYKDLPGKCFIDTFKNGNETVVRIGFK